MKVRALRGVCVGVDRNLKAGDTTDLEPAQVPWLVSIKAIEVVKDDPPPLPTQHTETTESKPEKSGKAKEK